MLDFGMGRLGATVRGCVGAAVLLLGGCDGENDGTGFREAEDAAVADECLSEVLEDAVDERSAANIDAGCIDCETLRKYLNALAAKISDESLAGRDTKALQAEYDALWVVYRRHC